MLVAAFVVLSKNTTWSGHFEAYRVAGFLKDLAEVFLWAFFGLLALAWLRTRGWRSSRKDRRRYGKASSASRGVPHEPFAPFPWTDRWLRDWREADASQRRRETPTAASDAETPAACRHGLPVDPSVEVEQAPVLRALSVSHFVVRPGASVSVTWCFEHCDDVVVDGRQGYSPCGQALVSIDRTRRIEVSGRNRHGSRPVATASVVAMSVPQLHLSTVESPPPVSLHTDVAATVGGATPITQRLDEFWSVQEAMRPRIEPPARVVGVPTSVIDGLRQARRYKGNS